MMFERTTVKVFFIIAITYLVIWLPYAVWQSDLPAGLEPLYAILGFAHLIPIAVLSRLGIPGLLDNNGHNCGWGWCGPTILGYLVTIVLWTQAAWLLAWLISKLISGNKGNR